MKKLIIGIYNAFLKYRFLDIANLIDLAFMEYETL